MSIAYVLLAVAFVISTGTSIALMRAYQNLRDDYDALQLAYEIRLEKMREMARGSA